jgi:signal transduction histidine kinase
MSISATAPSVDPSLLFRRLNEVRPLPTVARLTTLMVLFLTLWSHGQTQTWVMALLAVLFSWLVFTLWFQTTGRVVARADGIFHGAVIPLMLICVHSTTYGGLLIPLVIHPLTVITLLHGLRLGLVLAGIGAAGLLVSPDPLGFSTQHLLPALGVLLIPLMANIAARPIAALRRRVALAAELERELDPRRGLQAVGLVVADRLRQATGAQRVILFHRDAEVPTVLVADRDDSAYEASPALASRLLPVLAELPVTAMSLNVDSALGSGLSSEAALAARQAVEPQMRQIASLLEARTLQLVPDAPGESRSGWLLVAYGQRAADRGMERSEPWPLSAVAAFAAEMRRLLQQASYVDTLQAEIAAHERARIGRDLHDSAVQPYLGLKFAIDVVAQRCTPDNPIHAQVQDLRQFCEAELNELRDTVAVLRTGTVRGDNSLVPALRRQAKRFTTLFGIETTLDLPEELVISRALSGAVLHMVNEALNNVRRHSKAKNVWVKVSRDERGLQLVIRDDAGQRTGFPTPHFTPRSLSERAQELGGTLEVSRHQGLDTEVRIHIPA